MRFMTNVFIKTRIVLTLWSKTFEISNRISLRNISKIRYTVHLGRGIYQLIDTDPYPQNLRSRKKITKMSNPEPIPSSTVHTNYTYINKE